MTETKTISKKKAASACRIFEMLMPDHQIFKGTNNLSFTDFLMKTGTEDPSRQNVTLGKKWHPFDMRAMKEFRTWNPHHSRCIETKISCTVGLGFQDAEEEKAKQAMAERMMQAPVPQEPAPISKEGFDEGMANINNRLKLSKAEEVLNPLCEVSFQDLLASVASDRFDVGQAYFEVVRDKTGKIKGLHWVPAEEMTLIQEDRTYNRHYIQTSDEAGGDRHFAIFGDLEDFKKRASRNGGSPDAGGFNMPDESALKDISEVVVWRGALSLNRWYSYPKWLSAVPLIELVQMLVQHEFDFFQNRGVPEFMLFLLGKEIDDDEWKEIEDAVRGGIGLKKQHKSIAVNIKDEDVKVQLEKLAVEGSGGDNNTERGNSYALDIVTAHGTPPLLAGIVVPGKMGAANELPNALLAYQSLEIGPEQRSLWNVLAESLGSKKGIDGLSAEDFRLRAITDEFDLGKTDTMARMRTPIAQAQADGRDLGNGLRRNGQDKGKDEGAE